MDERFEIQSRIGNAFLSKERYSLISNSLKMCGQITYSEKYGNIDPYITYSDTNGTDVKRDDGGEPYYPATLNSAQFITWLFASNYMDITGGEHKEWTHQDYINNINVNGPLWTVVPSEEYIFNVAPGDLFIAKDPNVDRIGIFLGWRAGKSVDEAYILTLYPMPEQDYGTVRVIHVPTSEYYTVRPASYSSAPFDQSDWTATIPAINDLMIGHDPVSHFGEEYHRDD